MRGNPTANLAIGPTSVMLPIRVARAGISVPTRARAPTPVMPTERATPVTLFIMEVIAATGNLRNTDFNHEEKITSRTGSENLDSTRYWK